MKQLIKTTVYFRDVLDDDRLIAVTQDENAFYAIVERFIEVVEEPEEPWYQEWSNYSIDYV